MNIILTGVSKGLGLLSTKTLLEKGFNVYGVSRSMTEELAQLQKTYPDNLKHLLFDLAIVENIQLKMFKEWIGFHTPIHGFVNNAAIAYDDIVTNLKLALLLISTFFPKFLKPKEFNSCSL